VREVNNSSWLPFLRHRFTSTSTEAKVCFTPFVQELFTFPFFFMSWVALTLSLSKNSLWFQTMWFRSPDENSCINHALVVPPPGVNIHSKRCGQPIEHSLEGPLVVLPFFLQGTQKKAGKGQGPAVIPIIGNPEQS
jgi:hypothetical protein